MPILVPVVSLASARQPGRLQPGGCRLLLASILPSCFSAAQMTLRVTATPKTPRQIRSRPYIGRRFPKHVVFCGIPVVPCKVVRCSKGHTTISCNSGTSSRWCVPLPAGLSPRFRKTTDGSSTTAGSFASGVSLGPTFSPLPQVEAGTHTSLATTDVRQSFAFHARLLLRCWAGSSNRTPAGDPHCTWIFCVRPGGVAAR